MAIEFGLIESACFLIGLLFGWYLQNTNRFEYKKWEKIFEVLAFILGGTIVTYSFDKLFNIASFSLFAFWFGLIVGYYGSLLYREGQKSRLALIRGFARAGSTKK